MVPATTYLEDDMARKKKKIETLTPEKVREWEHKAMVLRKAAEKEIDAAEKMKNPTYRGGSPEEIEAYNTAQIRVNSRVLAFYKPTDTGYFIPGYLEGCFVMSSWDYQDEVLTILEPGEDPWRLVFIRHENEGVEWYEDEPENSWLQLRYAERIDRWFEKVAEFFGTSWVYAMLAVEDGRADVKR